ncbi:hypothetical protein QF034_008170 [Streptomyces africanus]|uniref:Uncharacterized protein n=1 Tax=Streptomyces africanus TaxID=231024 RepID=A0ABU0R2P3_9ACTN|nr:hypothetical protein [Streptomyces africanus]
MRREHHGSFNSFMTALDEHVRVGDEFLDEPAPFRNGGVRRRIGGRWRRCSTDVADSLADHRAHRGLIERLEAAVGERGGIPPRRRRCGWRRRSRRAGTGRSRARPRWPGRCLACGTSRCPRRRRRGSRRGSGRRPGAGTPAYGMLNSASQYDSQMLCPRGAQTRAALLAPHRQCRPRRPPAGPGRQPRHVGGTQQRRLVSPGDSLGPRPSGGHYLARCMIDKTLPKGCPVIDLEVESGPTAATCSEWLLRCARPT